MRSTLSGVTASDAKWGASRMQATGLQQQRVYVHYSNGVYMGGMQCYKRLGRGIVLLDEGACCLSQYCHDTMTGHNVVYRQDIVISALISKLGKSQIAVRNDTYILKFTLKQGNDHPQGQATLIDFRVGKIYYLVYHGDQIVKKVVESNQGILKQVFEKQLVQKVIDRKHVDAFRFKLRHSSQIRSQVKDDKVTIGYTSQYGYLDGLGFKLKVWNSDDWSQPLQLSCSERGNYCRGRLQNYGQRTFENGNLFIGQFKDDFFHGRGILKYPDASKWVFGQFQGQKLVKMYDMQAETGQRSIKDRNYLKDIHAYNDPVSYIGSQVQLIKWRKMLERVDEAVLARVTDVAVEKEREEAEEEIRLRKIQEHFSFDKHSKQVDPLLYEQFTKELQVPETMTLSSPQKTERIQIKPRNRDNEEYWTVQPVQQSTARKTFQLSSFKNKIKTPKHVQPPEEDHYYKSRYQTRQSAQDS